MYPRLRSLEEYTPLVGKERLFKLVWAAYNICKSFHKPAKSTITRWVFPMMSNSRMFRKGKVPFESQDLKQNDISPD